MVSSGWTDSRSENIRASSRRSATVRMGFSIRFYVYLHLCETYCQPHRISCRAIPPSPQARLILLIAPAHAPAAHSSWHPLYQQCGHRYTDHKYTLLPRTHRRFSSCRRWSSSSAWRLTFTAIYERLPLAPSTRAASTPVTPCRADTSSLSAPLAPSLPATSKPYANASPWQAMPAMSLTPAI